MANTITLDPSITNRPIQICMAYGEELKRQIPFAAGVAATDAKIWTPYHFEWMHNISRCHAFYGKLCEQAFKDHDIHLLTVGQNQELTKLKELTVKVTEAMDRLNKTITARQSEGCGYQPASPQIDMTRVVQEFWDGQLPTPKKAADKPWLPKVMHNLHNSVLPCAVGSIASYLLMPSQEMEPMMKEGIALGAGLALHTAVWATKAPIDLWYGVENNSLAALPWKGASWVCKTGYEYKAYVLSAVIVALLAKELY